MRRASKVRRILCLLTAILFVLPIVSTAVEAAILANWLSPLPGQSLGRYVEVSVSYNTQSSLKITKLELYIDGYFNSKKLLIKPENKGVASFTWDTAGYTKGFHQLRVDIYAGAQTVGSISGTGSVGASKVYDTTPPKIVFTNIKNNSVLNGIAQIKMNATDNSGNPPIVSFFVNEKLKMLKNTTPFVYDLDTTEYDDGSYKIETYAFDGDGNKSESAVANIVIKNNTSATQTAAGVSVEPKAEPKTQSKPVVAAKPIIPSVSTIAKTNGTAARMSSSEPKTIIRANPIAEKTVVASKIAVQTSAVKSTPINNAAKTISLTPVAVKSENNPLITAKATKIIVDETDKTIANTKLPKIADTNVVKPSLKVAEADKSVTTTKSAKIESVISTKPVLKIADAQTIGNIKARLKSANSNSLTSPKLSNQTQISRVVVSKQIVVKADDRPIIKDANSTKVTVVQMAKLDTKSMSFKPEIAKQEVSPVVVNNTKPVIKIADSQTIERIKQKLVEINSGNIKSEAKSVVIAKAVEQPKPIAVAEVKEISKPVIVKTKPVAAVKKSAEVKTVKSVKVAFAPDVKTVPSVMKTKYVRPDVDFKSESLPVVLNDIPKSGKIRLRDAVKKLDGFVLWDSDKKLVTAYVKNIKLEMRIGKNIVRVNGQRMKVSLVPSIVKGRTVIDVRILHDAAVISQKTNLKKQAAK